jgi:TolB protein
MRKRFSNIPAHITIFVLTALALLSCSRAAATKPPAAVESITAPSTPTATATFIPATPKNAEEIVVFSYEEDGNAHLFAYIPGKMPLTRLTSGDWDDVTPAASPDGKQIAFSSNRSGFWDLYLLDLASGKTTQLTDTPDYESAPAWSPDGAFLAYETYRNDALQIVIGPSSDPAHNAVQLTDSGVSSYSPAWAPGGRQIAFISNGEVMLSDLDKTDASRLTNLSNTDLAAESHPVWSPDGKKLAWASLSQSVGRSGIYVWDAVRNVPAEWIGDGDYPAWNPSGNQIITTISTPNDTYITTYSLDGKLLQPLTPFPSTLRGLAWANLILPNRLPDDFQQAAQLTPAPLWAASSKPISNGASSRWTVVNLPGVQAPYPQLSDLADEAFNALRERVTREAGWDALASLENAFVPLSSTLDPGYNDDWLYTGRAFAINSLMTNAGWMIAVREDFDSQTFWRLYIRAQVQDGSLGEPLHDIPWDLSARYNLDPQVYEQGGKYTATPPGYWVDVTSLARQYGWQRLPALPNWRTYFRGARFTEFALTDGLDFYSALLQLYPPDVLVTPTRLLPPTLTPTRTPTFTPSPLPTRTRLSATPSITATPSNTPTPSRTPLPTSTPPTIIPP